MSIPVTVLTGFLGSGKTTILSKLVRDPAFADTAVIVNEFGEIGLDHVLLEAVDENIVDLSCGCICCTIRGDLISTLADLRARRGGAFGRVAVETTGLADPAPVIHTLMQEPSVFESYRLARVVAAVDAVNAMETLDRHGEAVKQVAVADALLLTKTDIAGSAAALRERLRAINPGARTVDCVDGAVDPDLLFSGGIYDPATRGAEFGRHVGHGDGISTFAISRDRPLGRGALGAFLQMLADQRGGDLLRVKGLAALADDPARPAVVHGVQHVVHPARRLERWPEGFPEATTLVFIARGIDPAWVEDLLESVATSPYAAVAG